MDSIMPHETGIGKRVRLAIQYYQARDYEEAAVNACIAAAATSRKEFPHKKDGAAFKSFLGDIANMQIITGVMGCCGAGFSMPCDSPAVAKYINDIGSVSLQEILYHVIRCGTLHTSEWPKIIEITDNIIGGGGLGKPTYIPRTIIEGILMTVIASGANAQEHTMLHITLRVGEASFLLNDLWGTRVMIHQRILAYDQKVREILSTRRVDGQSTQP